MTEVQKQMLVGTIEQIEKDNMAIMNFLYDHVEPEQSIDDIEDTGLKTICNAIKKWYAEMGEYWVDDAARIIHNSIWGTCIRVAIKKFNENRYVVDDEELAIVNGNF